MSNYSGVAAGDRPAPAGPDRPVSAAHRAPVACATFHAHPAKIARLRRRLLDARAGSALADIFKVLGDLTRVQMLDALSQAELCVCDLAALVGLSESAVSHQLRLLRNLRVVRSRRAGRMVFYALDDAHIMELLEQGRRHVQETEPPLPVTAEPRRPRPAAPGGRVRRGGTMSAGMAK